jgi:methylphosphotriester-DNA--protein-cysteine methyltransferase
MDQLLQKFEVPERVLLKLFNRCIGVTPKLYMRLYRFNCVVRQLENEQKSLEDMMTDAGYAGQDSFVNDFLRFTHCRPAVLRREENNPLSRERVRRMLQQIG